MNAMNDNADKAEAVISVLTENWNTFHEVSYEDHYQLNSYHKYESSGSKYRNYSAAD